MEYSSVNAAGGKDRPNVKSYKATIPRPIASTLGLSDKDRVSWDIKHDDQGFYVIMRKAKEGEKQ